ncbi:MAG: thioredoxin [Candidatus Omnitrophica bacterium]|nr:thioredoxin [Candidatus Omnitrophota bacterium]
MNRRKHRIMKHAIELTEKNFEAEIIKSKIPAIVDFWAEWCMPCKMISPVVDEIAKEFSGKVKIGKVNVDENTELVSDLTVMNIPTLVFFNGGKEVKRVVGVVSKKELLKKMEEVFEE